VITTGWGLQITEGMLFRVEAAVALFAAIFVLLSSRWLAALIAAVVAASAVAALLLSVYWDIGGIGPFPDLYEPIWFTEKIIAVVAEAVSALAAIVTVLVAAPWKQGGRLRKATDSLLPAAATGRGRPRCAASPA
jgi:hypothetical protein